MKSQKLKFLWNLTRMIDNILLIILMSFGGLSVFILIVWVALWFVDKIPDDKDLGKK